MTEIKLMRLCFALMIGTGVCGLTLQAQPTDAYVLGPEDQIRVAVLDRKEIEIRPAAVALDGTVDLQYAGKLRAQGRTTEQLAREVEARLASIVRNPKVTVEVSEYGSQPVSILGAVNKPGVHQIRGRKSLVEVLSLAEGLKNEASNVIKITRPAASGTLPLPNAQEDASGQFMTAELSAKDLLEARIPEANILIRPHDVITIPRAELVYVLGGVQRPGGFPLLERESLTVLQAIALAEGIGPDASPGKARILRNRADGVVEVAVDVKKILANKAPNLPLEPNDVLFVPTSGMKSFSRRLIDSGLQMATGVVIFGR